MKTNIRLWALMLGYLGVGTGMAQDNSLTNILNAVGQYCDKLDQTTFNLLCRERVKERYINIEGKKHKVTLLYDYRIISDGEQIKENRTLLKRDWKKEVRENARLESIFYSQFPLTLSILFFAKRFQPEFTYTIQGEEMISNEKCWVLEMQPRQEQKIIMFGKAWVSQRDYSVIRIDLHPYAIGGFPVFNLYARLIGAELILVSSHWFEEKIGDLRFPSRTQMQEGYIFRYDSSEKEKVLSEGDRKIAKPQLDWVWLRRDTQFDYSGYHFFTINTKVTIH